MRAPCPLPTPFTRALSALPIVAAAGLAPAEIPTDLPGIPTPYATPGPITGHLYYKVSTGEAVFTPAEQYLADRARTGWRAPGDDINGDGAADYWVATNTDICAPTVSSSGIATGVGIIDTPPTIGDYHHFKAQFAGTDHLISTIQFTFWTDIVDVDLDTDGFADGLDGKGLEISFWDREDVFGQASSICPADAVGSFLTRRKVVTYGFTGLPGVLDPTTPGQLAGTIVTVDLSGMEMEIADSDGIGPASGFFNAGIATADVIDPFDLDSDSDFNEPDGFIDGDTDRNGSFDWAYSFRGIQPTATVAGGVGTPDAGRIGYSLVAHGASGTGGQIHPTTMATTPPFGVTTDGIADYFDRVDQTPNNADHTRIVHASIIEPMASGFPFTSAVVPTIPSHLQRYSLFEPDILGSPDPTIPFHGCPTSDFFFFGQRHDTDGDTIMETTDTYVGGLNCVSDIATDTDGDTIVDTAIDGVVDGQPSALGYLVLGPEFIDDSCLICPCDIDGDGKPLGPDDIEAFITAFLANDLAADMDIDGNIDPDDIAAFVQCFTSPPCPGCIW